MKVKTEHNLSAADRLAKACEPVFEYIGESNRLARRGSPRSAAQIRQDLLALFEQIARANATDYEIASFLTTPEPASDGNIKGGEATLAMMCFSDLILRLREPTWRPLAADCGFPNGDRVFVEQLESALRSNDEQRRPVLAVYYTCVGLGFGGAKTYDLNWMRDAAARLGQKLGANYFGGGIVDQPVWDQPYKPTYLGDHRPPTGRKLLTMLSVFAGLVLLLIGFSIAAYHSAEGKIRKSLDTIMHAAGADAEQ